ncbi:MAG: hypothetical protein PUP92_26875 [Rhizonema sp. PD38]|nr:hypothetical protein [Rhizonema sp. PD38]
MAQLPLVATPSGGNQGIYTNSGGTITKITDTNAVSSLFYNLPPSFYSFSQTVDINNNGTVAFLANVSLGSSGSSSRLVTAQNGSLTAHAAANRSAHGNGSGIIEYDFNNNEELAYINENLDTGTYTFSDTLYISRPNQPSITVVTALYQAISPFASRPFSFISGAVINNQSQITFDGIGQSADSQDSRIYRSNGDSFNILINQGTSDFGTNDNGDVVFSNSNAINLFNNASSTLTTIADSSSAFKSFSNVTINNNGDVAFGATLTTGALNIFTGADSVGNKVIATGEPLFNSTVTNLTFSRKGLNNVGQIVFYAELADGTKGIFLATESADDGS